MEFFGFKKEVKAQIFKLITTQICSSSCSGFKSKADFLHYQFNSIPGITCNKIQGALYAFPRLNLTNSFIKHAKDLGMQPDEYNCFQLLEEKGVCVLPGSSFKQLPNTYHLGN
ncbi:hypothetical protein MXB_1930 [Myxobolus squamalis]|nr:hypothetical protein MXB_1930 [Myxobolus squamalis]